jgi:hypothetical protein
VVQPQLREIIYYSFECPVSSLIFCLGYPFYFPKFARLLAGWKAVGVYLIAHKFSEACPQAPFSQPSLHANNGDLGLFPGKQYVILVGLVNGVKKDSASSW